MATLPYGLSLKLPPRAFSFLPKNEKGVIANNRHNRDGAYRSGRNRRGQIPAPA